jgi:hypothetical protein
MNITSPLLASAVRVAELPGDSVASLLKAVGLGTGLFDDSPDGGLGMIMSALAGVATALAVAIALSIYFRSGYRSRRDLMRHGLAASAVLVLLAFVISDMRNAALTYLGINPTRPAVEFEIRLPRAALSAVSDTQVELLTDRNQKLAQVENALAATDDGRSVLKGTVTLDYRTTDRVLALNLSGDSQCRFKLRLPASPTRSDRYSPWHIADGVTAAKGDATPAFHDAFAIRYRVL